jgi:hypothetical protein
MWVMEHWISLQRVGDYVDVGCGVSLVPATVGEGATLLSSPPLYKVYVLYFVLSVYIRIICKQ